MDIVLGGAGFIGSHLVDALIANGRHVRVIDNSIHQKLNNLAQARQQAPKPRHLEIYDQDITDFDALKKLFTGAQRVFHLAALADIVPSIQNPSAYYESNVTGTFNVVQAAVQAKVESFVYAASSSCYGIPTVYPTPETSPADPRYPYALTKYLGEQLVMHWAQVYGLPAISLRLFNVYGPRARTTGAYGAVFGVFLTQLLNKKPVTVVGDGTQTRDFTYVDDVVRAFLTAAESSKKGEIYNVGSNKSIPINYLVSLLKASKITHIPKRPGEPDCTLASTDKIKKDLQWEPRFSIEEGTNIMLKNIDYWRDAPLWTPPKIAEATQDWFRHLAPA